jgi:phosphate uptake regulator
MVMDFFRGTSETRLEEVEAALVNMLRKGRDVFDTAATTVFGGREPKKVKQDVKGTDRSINLEQQEVRRRLMIHAAVHPTIDISTVMAYMSIVKDAERIGDNAKNVYDLAKYGADFRGASDFEELVGYRDAVSQLILEAADVFEARDAGRAAQLIEKADGFLDEYDTHVKRAFSYDGPASEAVPRALYYRYLKRITAHVMNMLTALVMPLDRLDYYDEARDDR